MGKRGPRPRPDSRRSKDGRNTFKPELVDAEFIQRSAATLKKAKAKAKQYPVPKSIGRDAQTFWRRHMKHCSDAGTLTDETLEQFTELCLAYYRMRKAWRDLEKNDAVIVVPAGYLQRTPYAVEYDKALDIFKKLCDRFGLKPARRVLDADPSGGEATPKADDLLD